MPRKAIPSMPRPQTVNRQESEARDRLLEIPTGPSRRRAVSADRPHAARTAPTEMPRMPELSRGILADSKQQHRTVEPAVEHPAREGEHGRRPTHHDLARLVIPHQIEDDAQAFRGHVEPEVDPEAGPDKELLDEYDQRWILNLSMNFRDKSLREKFFVTYAEAPNKWRRVTVSLDYRNAPPDSLEADLSKLELRRDKSFQIYEAIRQSLPDIKFYPTVTNLKLETTPEDCQLHVHVREDANEIIHYPSTSLFDHVKTRRYKETEVEFLSHMSGFVYKVQTDQGILVKKEIPGPGAVDEFLYEVNALDSVAGCSNVVQLQGLVTDEDDSIVKGLLISYASKGALIDILYEARDKSQTSWARREKWARQTVLGLSDIHEAGFVQGDFTLSNICVDEDDNVQIIDVNRRGCPVGWEPPELEKLIDSGQRISMCIGVKTDLFQLGMVLWGLAEHDDEPDRAPKPLPPVSEDKPSYFRQIVDICLDELPQRRRSAKSLLRMFPRTASPASPMWQSPVNMNGSSKLSDHAPSAYRPSKIEYINPDMAVTLEDVGIGRRNPAAADLSRLHPGQVTCVDPRSEPNSTLYQLDSAGSWILPTRASGPGQYARSAASSATSISQPVPSRSQRRCGSNDSDADAVEESNNRGGPMWSSTQRRLPPHAAAEGADGYYAHTFKHDDTTVAAPSHHHQHHHHYQFPPAAYDPDLGITLPLLHTDSGFDEQMTEAIEEIGTTAEDHTKTKSGLRGDATGSDSDSPPSKYLPSSEPAPSRESKVTFDRGLDSWCRSWTNDDNGV